MASIYTGVHTTKYIFSQFTCYGCFMATIFFTFLQLYTYAGWSYGNIGPVRGKLILDSKGTKMVYPESVVGLVPNHIDEKGLVVGSH